MKNTNYKLDEFERYINGKKVAIIGLGISNIPLLDYLHGLNAQITIFDKKEISNMEVIAKCHKYGCKLITGDNALDRLEGFDIIFRSPSCRSDTPQIVAEVERGAILTSEIEMLMKMCPGKIIGVTGSDGKTTTTSLIYEIIKAGGYNCYIGGNIGIPLLTKIKEMTEDDIVILELSSFQLMNMQVSPDIAVITNISPNHLDIHKSYEEYINSKKNIFKYQNKDGILILNYDNDITREFAKEANGKIRFFSSKEKLEDGIIYDNGIIKECMDNLRRHIVSTDSIYLKGVHNFENICAAIAATKGLVDPEIQKKAVSKFKGVEHRLEFVRQVEGTKWYNDSIGTSPTRTIAGLNSFNKKIILIAGGYDKHLDYTPIAVPIIKHVSKLILTGETAPKIYKAVTEELKKEGKSISIYQCKDLETAINKAKEVSTPEEVVLFSPASASFDSFKNFEERGNKFKELVNRI